MRPLYLTMRVRLSPDRIVIVSVPRVHRGHCQPPLDYLLPTVGGLLTVRSVSSRPSPCPHDRQRQPIVAASGTGLSVAACIAPAAQPYASCSSQKASSVKVAALAPPHSRCRLHVRYGTRCLIWVRRCRRRVRGCEAASPPTPPVAGWRGARRGRSLPGKNIARHAFTGVSSCNSVADMPVTNATHPERSAPIRPAAVAARPGNGSAPAPAPGLGFGARPNM